MGRRTSLIALAALFFLVIFIFPVDSQGAPAAPPPTGITVRVLLQTTTTLTGQPLQFPLFRNVVTAAFVELAPGGQTGPQRFFVPAVVYVLEGTVTAEFEGQPPRAIAAGQVVVPPINVPGNGRNLGTTPARWLTVTFADTSKPAVSPPAAPPVGLRVTLLLRTRKTWAGEEIVFPLLANQLTASIVDLVPGAANLLHTHPPTQFFYAQEGVFRVEPEGHPALELNPGGSAVETTRPHIGANRGSVPARFFTVFAGEAGVPLTVNVRR